MSTSDDPLDTLSAVVDTTLTLTSQLEGVLSLADTAAPSQSQQQQQLNQESITTSSSSAAAAAAIDALALARDSASLIKAHATKISLFIINEPFAPTAVTKVLRELIAGPLPGLVSAVQVCDPAQYTQIVRRDLAWRSGRVLKEFKALVAQIPRDGKILADAQKNAWGAGVSTGTGASVGKGKGSIATTGVLWSACDDVIEFSKLGIVPYLVRTVEQFRDTLKDVLEELKEWAEEGDQANEDDDDDDDDDDDNEDDEDDAVGQLTQDLEAAQVDDTQAMLDDLMNSQQHIPRDDPERIRERLDSCLRRLRLTTLLFQAIVKRRLKALPAFPCPADSNVPARLDEVMALLRRIPERFGSLTLAFYELEPAEIDRLMDQCFFDVFAVSELLVKPWSAQKEPDQFAEWVAKFQVEIKKG